MKKLILILTVVFLCFGVARAELNVPDELSKLPALNQAVIFSLDDNELEYATTVTLVQLLNKKVNIDIGYTPNQELIASATAKLVEIKDYVSCPILEYIVIEPGVYVGVDRVGIGRGAQKENNEIDWGIICKLIEVKF